MLYQNTSSANFPTEENPIKGELKSEQSEKDPCWLQVEMLSPPHQRCFSLNLTDFDKDNSQLKSQEEISELDQDFGPIIEELKVSLKGITIFHVRLKKQIRGNCQINLNQALLSEIDSLKSDISNLKREQEKQVGRLVQLLKIQSLELENSKTMLEELQTLASLQKRIIDESKAEIGRLKEIIEVKDGQTCEQSSEQQKQEMDLPSEKKQPIFLSISSLMAHRSHQNNSCFQILSNQTLKKVSTEDIWQNFIFKQPIHFDRVYSLKLQIVKSSKLQIHLGVCTDKVFNQFNTRKNDNCITGMLDKGNIWMSGEEWANLDAKGVREGSVVEIEVDRIHGKVKWFKQAGIQAYMEVMGVVDLPEYLEFKNLFFFVTMFRARECVRLLRDPAPNQ